MGPEFMVYKNGSKPVGLLKPHVLELTGPEFMVYKTGGKPVGLPKTSGVRFRLTTGFFFKICSKFKNFEKKIIKTENSR
jgi:hypothetical protein